MGKSKRKPNGKLPKTVAAIHLPPLPGAPGAYHLDAASALNQAGAQAVHEAKILQKLGFEGLILENFGDMPLYKERAPAETIASLAVIASAVKESTRLKVGINVLRNDAQSALAIAAVTACDFIRVNVLSGVVACDQGIIEGRAADLLRERLRLGADVAILADAHVKHAQALSQPNLNLAIEELATRSGADAIIITGPSTGREPDLARLEGARETCKRLSLPFYIGSGSQSGNLSTLKAYSSYFIVGSDLRKNGLAGQSLDPVRCKRWLQAYKTSKAGTSKKKRAKK